MGFPNKAEFVSNTRFNNRLRKQEVALIPLSMKFFTKTGRLFYGIGIVAFGMQQIIIRDFRPEILPEIPAWPHKYIIFPYVTGAALIIIGVIISGIFKIKETFTKRICLYLGLYFLVLIIIFQIPYCLIFGPNKAIHLGVWAATLKELAYSGGALVMAGSFSEKIFAAGNSGHFQALLKKLIPPGRIFFATTMILYGYCHFLYTAYISPMVPKWFGMPVFWTYFGGAALIGAGIAIILKILIKPVGYLLAIMLFLWFVFIHIPDAIANPYKLNGNEIVSAFDALLFCGIALIIANSQKQPIE